MSSIRYEFIMSQIKHIRDIKENEKTKISLVFYEGCQKTCVFKICKGRDLSEVYQALMEVRHPNIATVYDCVYEDGNTYVLEEYISGKTVAEVLAGKGTFSEEETSRMIQELCGGLEVMHRQNPPIIHNDIKSSNIMIQDDGSTKLFDFDISRTYKEGSIKNTRLMGTQEYAAPEHYGFGQSEPCTDIYSLGVTMHEMLTGVGLDQDHNVTYDGKLSKIIQKCVEVDRKKRFVSAELLKNELKRCDKRHIFMYIAAVVCALAVLGISGMFFFADAINRDKSNAQLGTEATEDEFEQVGDEETEEHIASEETEHTELIGKEEEDEDDVPTGGAPDVGNTDEEKQPEIDSSVTEKPTQAMKVIYDIEDTFLAMNVWADGAYVLMEEKSGAYFLRKSDGKEKHLEGIRAALGAQMEYNPYKDQMYLILFDYDVNYVYELSKALELKLVYEEEISMKNGAFLAFFSDGTLVYDYIRRSTEDWSEIEHLVSCPSTFMIEDTFYSFQSSGHGFQYSYRFLEMDEEGKVVNDFPLEDEEIVFEDWQNLNPIHNNSKEVYFIGNKAGKYYVFCFNGKEFITIKCLSDYADYVHFAYEELCVTEKGMRCYSNALDAIVEFTFE